MIKYNNIKYYINIKHEIIFGRVFQKKKRPTFVGFTTEQKVETVLNHIIILLGENMRKVVSGQKE